MCKQPLHSPDDKTPNEGYIGSNPSKATNNKKQGKNQCREASVTVSLPSIPFF
jgi:hypothetical protein